MGHSLTRLEVVRLLAAEDGAVAPAVAPARSPSCLTPREAEVVALLRQGLPNKLIAHSLGVSMSTIKAHLHSIMAKTGCSNRVALVVAGPVARSDARP